MEVTEAVTSAEKVAQLFHETYERLSPSFGYETRKASAVPWEQVPENNRRLMIATVEAVLPAMRALEPRASSDGEVGRLIAKCLSARANGDPAKYLAGLTVADAYAIAAALQSQPSSNAARLREVLEEAVAYIRHIARCDTLIMAGTLEAKADEIEALSNEGNG